MSEKLKAELEAILHRAAVARVDDRAFLRVTGGDATRWLNGMVTNSVQGLAPGEGCYCFLLNAQGRILGDCTVYREPDGDQPKFVLATSKGQVEAIQKHLDHFIIMDDVELTRMDYYSQNQLLAGPNASAILAKVEVPLLTNEQSYADLHSLRLAYYDKTADQITTRSPGIVPQFELASSTPGERELIESELVDTGATLVSDEAVEALRLLEGRPLYGRDITERYLPQETNQAQALHFNKGCYLGQEIVERIRSRGQVHRLLTPLTLEGAMPGEFPAPLEAEGKPVGEITSAAVVPLREGEQILALGYVRREALDTHAALTYAGGTARPREVLKSNASNSISSSSELSHA